MNFQNIIDAVDRALPAPTSGESLALRLQKRTVMVGAALEMAAARPSVKEIGDYIGIYHSTAQDHERRWNSMPWKDRYNWLRFVEGRLARETHTVDAALL